MGQKVERGLTNENLKIVLHYRYVGSPGLNPGVGSLRELKLYKTKISLNNILVS